MLLQQIKWLSTSILKTRKGENLLLCVQGVLSEANCERKIKNVSSNERNRILRLESNHATDSLQLIINNWQFHTSTFLLKNTLFFIPPWREYITVTNVFKKMKNPFFLKAMNYSCISLSIGGLKSYSNFDLHVLISLHF